MAWVVAGTAHYDNKKKTLENRANLPPTGAAGLNKLQRGGAPTQFISHFSLWLGPLQPDDSIREYCPAGIKAGSRESAWEDAPGR